MRVNVFLIVLVGVLAAWPRNAVAGGAVMGTNLGSIPDGSLFETPAGRLRYGAPRDVTFDVVGTVGTVSSVTVGFSASHSYVGDLRVRLVAPNGKEHLLFARTGLTQLIDAGSDSDLSAANLYRFSDAFATNWWTAAGPNGITVPSVDARTVPSGDVGVSDPPPATSMNAAFASTPGNGRWILRFDDAALGDVGTVTAATLELAMTGVTREVTSTSDIGPGTLRAALTNANPGDLVTFSPALFGAPRTIELQTGLPDIEATLAIEGPGAHLLTVQRRLTAADFRIFKITGGSVSIGGVTIRQGRASDFGGAIYSLRPLTLSRVHVEGNHANNGGGVTLTGAGGMFIDSTFSGNLASFQAGGIQFQGGNDEPLTLIGCTVSGNRAGIGAGAILNTALGGSNLLQLVNSDVVRNTSASGTGGILNLRADGSSVATVTLRNSIVAENVPTNLGGTPAGTGAVTSLGYNLSDNLNGFATSEGDVLPSFARIGPLAGHGGSTPTHPRLLNSAALDAGERSGAATDQRGQPRVFDISTEGVGTLVADIGAVETQAIVVSNVDDSGAGSLRAAISTANDNGAGLDDIVFEDSFFSQGRSIALTGSLPSLSSSMTITGPLLSMLSVRRDSGGFYRIFTIAPGMTVSLVGLTIANGDMDTGDIGGAIMNRGALAIVDSTIIDSHANGAGGIANQGALTMVGSSLVGNSANFDGGGLYNFDEGVARLVNCTLTGNHAGLQGGAIANASAVNGSIASVQLVNSTLVYNTATSGIGGVHSFTVGAGTTATASLRNTLFGPNAPPNLATSVFSGGGPASIVSRGFNLSDDNGGGFLTQSGDLINADPGLPVLDFNGGPTLTLALPPGSDARDAGSNVGSGVQTDQRGEGFGRVVTTTASFSGDGTDIGAFELEVRIFSDGLEAL